MDETPSYLEELVVLTIVGFLLLIAKLVVCCLSLGLHHYLFYVTFNHPASPLPPQLWV